MRVCGYVRVSTDEQAIDGYSIEEQIESIQKWCKDNGHPPAVIYVDDGYSAKDLNRPDVKRLLEDIKLKKYDISVTTKLNRLSRKLIDILNIIDLMEKFNCGYVSIQESFDTSAYIGRMQMQMLGVIAEFDRERIAEDVRNTMKSIARKSGETKKAFTVPCYGYDVIDGFYAINEKEAEAIQLMAKWSIDGMGSRIISMRLNELGIKTKTGTTWHAQTIVHLLNRETLNGTLVYNRTYKKNGKRLYRPEEEWIIIENHHQPILDDQIFEELKKSLQGRSQARKQADNEKWLLSGLVKCVHCGATMKGSTSRNRSRSDRTKVIKEYHRYVCSEYLTKGLCFFHYIFRDDLEQYVIDYVKKAATDQNSKKIKMSVTEPKNKDTERQSIESKLKRIDARMQKQIEAYENDLISAVDLKKARERIESEREDLNKSLSALVDENADESKARSNAKRYLNDILSDDRLTVKNGLRKMIHRVEVTDGESIHIVFHSN